MHVNFIIASLSNIIKNILQDLICKSFLELKVDREKLEQGNLICMTINHDKAMSRGQMSSWII